MFITIIIFIVLLFLSAFFSAAETALFSLSKVRVRTLVKQKKFAARTIFKVKENPKRLIITVLIGYNLANIGASILATVLATDILGSKGAGIAFGIVTFLILVFAEILPKSLAAARSIFISQITARPLEIISYLLLPLIIFFETIAKIVGPVKPTLITEEEVKTMAEMGVEAGTIETREKEIIEKIFRFTDITAEDVMTPRSKMVCLDSNLTVGQALSAIEEFPYSRVPVFEKSHDNIVGIFYIKDALQYSSEELSRITLKEIAKEPYFIPDKKPIDDLLKEFQKKAIHLAVVVNEYGEVIGLITLEDLVEELVGEIIDEKDIDRTAIKRLDKNTILVDGATEVGKINHFLNLELPEKAGETIAALILKTLGRIPSLGEELKIGQVILTAEEVTKRKIIKVKIGKIG